MQNVNREWNHHADDGSHYRDLFKYKMLFVIVHVFHPGHEHSFVQTVEHGWSRRHVSFPNDIRRSSYMNDDVTQEWEKIWHHFFFYLNAEYYSKWWWYKVNPFAWQKRVCSSMDGWDEETGFAFVFTILWFLPTVHAPSEGFLPRITPFCCYSRACCTRCRSVCTCGIFYAGIMTIQTYAHYACTCISREKEKCLIMHLEHSHPTKREYACWQEHAAFPPCYIYHCPYIPLGFFIRLLWKSTCITWQCNRSNKGQAVSTM